MGVGGWEVEAVRSKVALVKPCTKKSVIEQGRQAGIILRMT